MSFKNSELSNIELDSPYQEQHRKKLEGEYRKGLSEPEFHDLLPTAFYSTVYQNNQIGGNILGAVFCCFSLQCREWKASPWCQV